MRVAVVVLLLLLVPASGALAVPVVPPATGPVIVTLHERLAVVFSSGDWTFSPVKPTKADLENPYEAMWGFR